MSFNTASFNALHFYLCPIRCNVAMESVCEVRSTQLKLNFFGDFLPCKVIIFLLN